MNDETAENISSAAKLFAIAATGSVDAGEMKNREAASALMMAAAFMISRSVPPAEVEGQLESLFAALLSDLPKMLAAKQARRH